MITVESTVKRKKKLTTESDDNTTHAPTFSLTSLVSVFLSLSIQHPLFMFCVPTYCVVCFNCRCPSVSVFLSLFLARAAINFCFTLIVFFKQGRRRKVQSKGHDSPPGLFSDSKKFGFWKWILTFEVWWVNLMWVCGICSLLLIRDAK